MNAQCTNIESITEIIAKIEKIITFGFGFMLVVGTFSGDVIIHVVV